jgi:hypothetical protein
MHVVTTITVVNASKVKQALVHAICSSGISRKDCDHSKVEI